MFNTFEQRQSRGGRALYFGADAPDTSGQNAAALAQADLSKEQLAWAKEIYAEQAPDRAAAADRANAISDQQLASSKQNDAIAADYYKYQTDTYRPLEKSIVADAQAYDTPERREQNADMAVAGVQTGFDNAQAQQQRTLERSGVNPSSGAALALGSQTAVQKALALSGAANKSRLDTEQQGYARKMDAANLGRNLASNQATSASIATQAGNSSAANAGTALAATTSGTSVMQQGFTGASNSLNSAAGIYGNIANTQAGVSGSNASSTVAGLGAAATTAAIVM